MECIKWLMGEECKILGYDLTSINKGVISGIRIRLCNIYSLLFRTSRIKLKAVGCLTLKEKGYMS
jgi:hypothetical protein